MGVSIGGLIGLYGGMLCGILGWWFGRKRSGEQRGLDELHDHIWKKARSYAWFVTLVSIYILFSLVLFGIDMSVPMVLGIIMLVHMASWAFIGVSLSVKMTIPKPTQSAHVVIGVGIIVISVVSFTIISLVTVDWRFMLIGIPISLIGLLYARSPSKK